MNAQTTTTSAAGHRARGVGLLVTGALLLVLGAAALGMTSLLAATSAVVLGPLIVAGSIVQFMAALFTAPGKDRLLHFAAAGLEAVLGGFVLAHPVTGTTGLIAWIAIALVTVGAVLLGQSLTPRSRGRGWAVAAGALALLLALAVWAAWPAAELWFVGACVAADFLCHGLTWSALALAERRRLPDVVP